MEMCLRHGCIVFILFGALGCAGASQSVYVDQKPSGETTYETREMRLDDFEWTSGLQKKNRFYLQITGSCRGAECVPSQYWLNFIKEGPQPVTVEGREVTLTVGSETLTWEDPQTRDAGQTSTIRSGTFLKVDVTSKQLSTIGASRRLTGTIGGERFSVSHRERAPIRALLSRLEQRTDESVTSVSQGRR